LGSSLAEYPRGTIERDRRMTSSTGRTSEREEAKVEQDVSVRNRTHQGTVCATVVYTASECVGQATVRWPYVVPGTGASCAVSNVPTSQTRVPTKWDWRVVRGGVMMRSVTGCCEQQGMAASSTWLGETHSGGGNLDDKHPCVGDDTCAYLARPTEITILVPASRPSPGTVLHQCGVTRTRTFRDRGCGYSTGVVASE